MILPTRLSWREELTEILDVCEQRASLPVSLPHCAICARYATDNLPFEALMSLLDVLPAEFLPEAMASAEVRLASVSAVMRQQHVNAETLPVLMDSPGWPLVCSLVIDMANQAIHKHFDDPRLKAIEEITLLGFAYGGCEVEADFNEALFHSGALINLRSLSFHSTESDQQMSRCFWSSPMARQLEFIDGTPYLGDPVTGPLAVRELRIANCRELPEGFSLAPLLDPKTTPHLATLSLSAYFDGIAPLLQLLAQEAHLLERIPHVPLRLSDFHGESTHLLPSATLPATSNSVSWYADYPHVSWVHIRGGCDIHKLYDSTDEKIPIRLGDKVTDYSGLVFIWELRDQISRRVRDLSLLLPLGTDIGEVIEFCSQLPELTALSIVYPLSESEIETLLGSETIRGLQSLTLLLSIEGGQWSRGKSEYMKVNESRYRSDVSARYLFELAFGEKTATIPNLSIATPSFELARSPERVQHWDIASAEAVYALAECDPHRPIEVLCFGYDITFDEPLAKAIAGSNILGRVYRLNLQSRLDEAAANILAGCEKLRTVRAFGHFCYHNPIEAIRTLLHSPNVCGAWDVHLHLPEAWKVPEIADICASSPLLDRAVVLELHGVDKSPQIPRSERLGRTRRLGEWLTMHVLGDARLALEWRAHPIGRPLRVGMDLFIERTYRISNDLEDIPELENRLRTCTIAHDESEFQQTLQRLLATAFGGKPAPENAKFTDLSEPQQRVLRTLASVNEHWWSIGGLVRDVTLSYGFSFWEKDGLEKYIADEDTSDLR